jgi:hypothetical protein
MANEHRPGWINRTVRWLCRTPFENLPPDFGKPAQPEMLAFELDAERAQETGLSEPGTPETGHARSRPARHNAPQGRH